ncbi:polyketide synthase [Whalleya microplaca]|nr:polyketide synthase [Whalleya microplaca]
MSLGTSEEPIAIIGSAYRFAGGANSPSKLWELLKEPRDILSEIPESRFNAQGFYHSDGQYHGHSNVHHSYLLSEDPASFDAQFFGVKPVEARALDPQQRFLLETVYESLESAGLTIEGLRGSDTGVYVGLTCNDYEAIMLRDHSTIPSYFSIGIGRSIMSNRISYFFNWHGPSMTLDTACSSSLYAVHLAVQALRVGDTRAAVACGSKLILGPENYITESKLNMLSPDSRSRMWDANANGYARGDGVVAVVLKTLSAALEDGDHIDGLIRETSINQDGAINGITMPSATSQRDLIRKTYAKAGLDPLKDGRCQYFEAHGTGTLAGDPIEPEAIKAAFFHSSNGVLSSPEPHRPLYVGSIKTVVGRTEATSGVAALLKAVLAVQTGYIPANMLFTHLNPAIEPFYSGLEVPTSTKPWPALPPGHPRRASVNSFGFGGSNAHAIIESYEPCPNNTSSHHDVAQYGPYVFSANSEQSLVANLAAYKDFLHQHGSEIAPRNLAWTLRHRRSVLPLKIAFPAGSIEKLKGNIEFVLEEKTAKKTSLGVRSSLIRPPRILGIFTGQGAQYARMGAELFEKSPLAQSTLRQLEDYLTELPVYDRPSWSLINELLADKKSSRMGEAEISQPLCTAIQIILVDLLREAKVTLSGVVGHSSGEIGAAYAATYLSARDAIYIAYYRGLHSKLAASPNGQNMEGAMLAVGTSREDAQNLLSDGFENRAVVAASNSASSVTLSGDEGAIAELEVIFEEKNKFRRRLEVDKAYHSNHMLPCSEPYIASLKACHIEVQRPCKDCVWYSTVYKAVDMGSPEISAKLHDVYWTDNMTQPVLFSQGLAQALSSDSFDAVLEVGPHSALRGPASQIIQDVLGNTLLYQGMLTRNTGAIEAISTVLGFIWCNQAKPRIDLNAYEVAVSGTRNGFEVVKNLPSYQWDHDRVYWHESRQSRNMRRRQTPVHPLLGDRTPDSSPHNLSWRNLLKIRELPWLSGHQFQGKTVFPAAGYISTMLEASRSLALDGHDIAVIDIQDFTLHQAMPFDDEDAGIEILVSMMNISHDEPRHIVAAKFTYSAAVDKDSEFLSLVASGNTKVHLGDASSTILPTLEHITSNLINITQEEFYTSMKDLGYGNGGPFRELASIKRKFGKAECRVAVAPLDDDMGSGPLLVHPAMLDYAMQAIIVAYCHPSDGQLWSLHVPTVFDRIRVNPFLCGSAWGEAKSVPVSAATFECRGVGFVGDVDIYGSNNSHTAIQIQGLKVIPLAAATAADDEKLFSRSHWASINADGDDIAKDYQVTQGQHELALAMERMAFYYMRKFERGLPADHPARSDSAFSSYLRLGQHMIELAETGRHRYAEKEWATDTLEVIQSATAPFSDTIDIRIAQCASEEISRVLEGETIMLDHFLPTGLLSDYYVNALGMQQSLTWIGRAVKQLAHHYPRMNILEIGAGTGGATNSILQHIGHDFETYTFTDLSTGFFQEAELLFSPYKTHMVFCSLDVGADPITQGFTPGSYDLIVASLRHGFVFGTLPGWWAGAGEGRNISPYVPPERWDNVLRNTGFAGMDTITPSKFMDTYATSVFITQAVDEKVTFLREPLVTPTPSSMVSRKDTIQDLVIIGGSTLWTAHLVAELEKILIDFSNKALYFMSLADVQHHKFSPGSTVLSLSELDKPIFQDMVHKDFEGLKQLIASEKTLLWVTNGRRARVPHANMSFAFLQNGRCENRELRLQSLDFEGSKPDARTIAEALIRLDYASKVMATNNQTDLLWSIEPEIIVDSIGRHLVRRIVPMVDANNRYNSGRRIVTREINANETAVMFQVDDRQQYNIQDVSLCRSLSMPETSFYLRASHAILSPIKTPLGPRFLTLGPSSKSSKKVLTLAKSLASILPVAEDTFVECDECWTKSAEKLISLTAANLFAASILESLISGQKLLVHNSDTVAAKILSRGAEEKGVSVFFTTDSLMDENNSTWISIPEYLTKRQIRDILPDDISLFILFGSAPSNTTLISCLSACCRIETFGPALSDGNGLFENDGSTSRVALADALSKALRNVEQRDSDLFQDPEFVIPPSFSCADIAAGKVLPNTIGGVIQWTENNVVQAQVNRLDANPIFKSDKTYWLVGLSRHLGLSICDWMIRCGAKYIIITSRNPQVEAAWEEAHSRKGIIIKIVASDISDSKAVEAVYNTISSSHPPLSGIIHGAMVLDDHPIREMNVNELEAVLGPKVAGSRNIDRILSDTPLDFFLFLSSMINVVGNIGQSNYCAANAYMSSLAAQRRKRGLAGSVVNIGLVKGAGYITREDTDGRYEKRLLMAGLRRVSEGDIHQMLAEGIEIGRSEIELPIEEDPEISIGLRTISPLDEWQPLWADNPIYRRYVVRELEGGDGPAANQKEGTSVKDRLQAAKTNGDVFEVIKKTFLEKLRVIMLIEHTDDDTLINSLSNDMGMDSLIAVDLRSWMWKNYSVAIPVPEILDSVYISELINKAHQGLPPELVPNVDVGTDEEMSTSLLSS